MFFEDKRRTSSVDSDSEAGESEEVDEDDDDKDDDDDEEDDEEGQEDEEDEPAAPTRRGNQDREGREQGVQGGRERRSSGGTCMLNLAIDDASTHEYLVNPKPQFYPRSSHCQWPSSGLERSSRRPGQGQCCQPVQA